MHFFALLLLNSLEFSQAPALKKTSRISLNGLCSVVFAIKVGKDYTKLPFFLCYSISGERQHFIFLMTHPGKKYQRDVCFGACGRKPPSAALAASHAQSECAIYLAPSSRRGSRAQSPSWQALPSFIWTPVIFSWRLLTHSPQPPNAFPATAGCWRCTTAESCRPRFFFF